MINKKLIFLRKGNSEFQHLTKLNCEIAYQIIDVDKQMFKYGYNNALEIIRKIECKWFITTCPTVLSATDEHNNHLWWNEKKQTWDIYFVENGKLKRIQEFTDKELRKAHNIEKMYLNGVLDDKEET